MFKDFNKYSKDREDTFSINKVTLAFHDSKTENRFRKAYFENNLQVGRACHIIAIFFYCLVGLWDGGILNSSRLQIWIWVMSIVSLIFLLGLASSFLSPKFYGRYWQQLYTIYVLSTGAGFMVVAVLSGPEYPAYNFVGIIFCLFFCYAFIRLTFLWAVAAGNAIVILYTVVILIFLGPSAKLLLTDLFYMMGINLLGIMVCYSQELMSRRDFMLNTLLKKAEKKTKTINVTLEGKLIQAQKMESIGRLAGGVAHDYNNISSIIIGYTELSMEKVPRDDPLYSNLETILNAATKATDITRQLLAFARKQTIDPKVIDLNLTIESMLKILRRLIGENIDLAWRPGKKVWSIKIDPTQVDQILANLCVNARDAISDTGKVTIETKNISFDENYCTDHEGFIPGDFSMIGVSDDGQGMGTETLNKIFEPFFTTKNMGHGTGLGLATVYGIVKQNNGFINVYSEPRAGTTIKIYIPRHQGPIHQNDLTDRGPSLGLGETILIVEDDTSILELGQKMLKSLGYKVWAVNSPPRAIELIKDRKIDLLLTDVILPEMNGRELADRLLAVRPDLKILFMSGYTANVIAHRGVLEQGVNFIPKPFSKKELAIRIRNVLDCGENE